MQDCYNLLLETGYSKWILIIDTFLNFPAEVAVTSLRPDIVLWSKTTMTVMLCELMVPSEDHDEKAYERKKEKYQYLIDTHKEMG